MTATAQQFTAWPEGVIARYLNLADAPIEITFNAARSDIVVDCTGCPWQKDTNTGAMAYDTPEEEATRVEEHLPASHRAAQEHAERCRGVARPTA